MKIRPVSANPGVNTAKNRAYAILGFGAAMLLGDFWVLIKAMIDSSIIDVLFALPILLLLTSVVTKFGFDRLHAASTRAHTHE